MACSFFFFSLYFTLFYFSSFALYLPALFVLGIRKLSSNTRRGTREPSSSRPFAYFVRGEWNLICSRTSQSIAQGPSHASPNIRTHSSGTVSLTHRTMYMSCTCTVMCMNMIVHLCGIHHSTCEILRGVVQYRNTCTVLNRLRTPSIIPMKGLSLLGNAWYDKVSPRNGMNLSFLTDRSRGRCCSWWPQLHHGLMHAFRRQ